MFLWIVFDLRVNFSLYETSHNGNLSVPSSGSWCHSHDSARSCTIHSSYKSHLLSQNSRPMLLLRLAESQHPQYPPHCTSHTPLRCPCSSPYIQTGQHFKTDGTTMTKSQRLLVLESLTCNSGSSISRQRPHLASSHLSDAQHDRFHFQRS